MTAKCVHELLKTSYQNYSIVIVDNGSCDGSVEYLSKAFPSIPLIESEDNLEFSRGCNLGIKHALANGAEYVALIDNDLILESDGYKEAMRGFEDDPSIGAVTGKIFTSDRHVLWQAGGYISRLRISGRVRGHFEIDRHKYDSPEFTGWASGAMSVFSADALNRVGLLPEEYFLGQEEWVYRQI
jgi:GT2 family glycosyltransferase